MEPIYLSLGEAAARLFYFFSAGRREEGDAEELGRSSS